MPGLGAAAVAGLRAKSALVWEITGFHTHVIPETGALFAMEHNGWAHALKVTGGGTGLIGHAGAVLLRKAADQAGLTAGLGAALRKAGMSPVLDRGIVLVSMAAAIALGATSMSDIAVLAHLAPVLGAAPSGPTIRRALGLAGAAASLERIARARAKARAHAWKLIEDTPAGFPWLAIAGKTLAGWLVIDLDATLVTAHSDKEGAARRRARRAPTAAAIRPGTGCGCARGWRRASGAGRSRGVVRAPRSPWCWRRRHRRPAGRRRPGRAAARSAWCRWL